jgi:hypothetical protein
MEREKERIFIGNVADFQLKDAINDQLQSFRRSLTELNEFVQLDDVDDILKNGSKNISQRFEEHLWQLNASIQYFPDRERHKQGIPVQMEYFTKQAENAKRNYDNLPEFLDKERLLTYEYDGFGRISCKWDYKLLDQAIQEQCVLYAETDKEIEIFELIKELVDLVNKIKTVAGVEVKVTDIISDRCDREATYNTDVINNLFKRIKTKNYE